MIATHPKIAVLGVAIVVMLAPVVPTGAEASISQPSVVSENPANFTPNVQDDAAVSNAAVHAFGQIKGTMYAGGAFRTVTDATNNRAYTRNNIMGFNATTGDLTSFKPTMNGTVWAIQPGGSSLFVGGEFTTVNGEARRSLVKLDAVTGQVDQTFRPNLPAGNVTEVRLVDGRLLVGGTFPKKLVALDPTTGADTGYIDIPITGTVASNAGPTRVYRFAVNPAGTRLVAVGNFTTVSTGKRWQVFMLNLGVNQATLNSWYYTPLENACSNVGAPAYMRDVDFSPDGSYFVTVSTGYVAFTDGIGRDLCDAAARFETANTSPDRPTWINYTGGDTLHSVAVTGAAAYVQGHQRWLDNPFGRNDAGVGAVAREGIGAIDPKTGTALSWNPGKTRDVGGKELYATTTGLWVGSDGSRFNGETRSGIAFCPL